LQVRKLTWERNQLQARANARLEQLSKLREALHEAEGATVSPSQFPTKAEIIAHRERIEAAKIPLKTYEFASGEIGREHSNKADELQAATVVLADRLRQLENIDSELKGLHIERDRRSRV
jgi:hypothetical protein